MSSEAQDGKRRVGRSQLAGYVQLAAVVVAIVVAVYFAQAPDRTVGAGLELEAAPMPVVSVIEPRPTRSPLVVELTGTVGLATSAAVQTEVAAKVVWISPNFRSGASIPAGETIVRLDPTDLELLVEAAEGAVEEAEALVWREEARGKHDADVFARNHPGIGISDRVRRLPSLARRQAQLMQAQTMLKAAEEKLRRTSVSLPFDSQVLSVSVELGELALPVKTLGTVYRTTALQTEVPVEPRILEQLAPVLGRAAQVRADGTTYRAEVERVSAAVSPTSRLATLFLKFSDTSPGDALPRPGTFALVSIDGPDLQDVYVLPESAEQDRASVWIVEGGKLRSHSPRTLGRGSAGWIVSGFDAGDGIVLGTINGAREGLAVQVADVPPAAGAEG